MPLSRVVTLIVGLIVILALTLWLIDSLSRLYWQLSYSPLLGNLLLLLLIFLIGGLIAAFVYYVLVLRKGEEKSRRQRQRVTPAQIPAAKSDAASSTLQAVRQQVAQIQDEVTRQALLSRTRDIEANLARGEIQVVVFGTGSAGKTSLVNAIMGRIVGEVNAPMGTTQVGETYCLRLKGLERKILITDTPGILEPGVGGTEREQLARALATEADLLLFVVDNDLRRSEYEPLRGLAEIGKRSLLVLNKTDLYTDTDRDVILGRLRSRVRSFIATNDVVAIAANPQIAKLETGETFQPEPDIIPLLRRMASILRAEGEDLVADNILLQSLRLGEEARKLIDSQRRRQADKIIVRYQWIGAGVVSVTPLPVVDLLATAAVNAQMVVEIGKIYGCDLNMERGKELALSLGKTIAGLGIVKGAIQLLSTALQLNVTTFVVGRAIQGVTAAYLTRIAGKSFIEYFRHDQDWGDGGMTEVVQQQFQINRRDEFIKVFVQEAIAKVVKPLTDSFTDKEEYK
ncbi:GTP-binding protein [Dolichospermum circinale CS-534/05]|uniref:YcjF family protein n=1 Tax=Dolichospermum circinale TaxID=109265 RepID=UPI00232EAAEA|nr:GTP-binding protein [Dolichospermum circinale]MDB9453037.1 GTP-binding protein [Dolichospermum circinale CS-541/06]MDB9464924.1 GTP-binding protein [Dolichospermum circinale CS-541/04]MDB9491092.1 GTP-binding protein [Dolichospermum circinale CS-534/05]MDB9549530.1 GTP-binding protein [Dolichospermum circinale CS-1031]